MDGSTDADITAYDLAIEALTTAGADYATDLNAAYAAKGAALLKDAETNHVDGSTDADITAYDLAIEALTTAGADYTTDLNAAYSAKGAALLKDADANHVKGETEADHAAYDLAIGVIRQAGDEYQAQVDEAFDRKGTALLDDEAYDDAISAYETAGELYTEHLKGAWYAKGDALNKAEEYGEAAACYLNAGDYLDAADKRIENLYLNGKKLTEAGEYTAAYDENFALIGDYKDTKEIVDGNRGLTMARRHYEFGVGKTVRFGRYEQDGVNGNGKEALEWIVLGKNGDEVLLLSRKVLDIRSYFDGDGAKNPCWRSSLLRTWLNGNFLMGSFSLEEKGAIVTVTHSADDRSQPSATVADQVFLLSREELDTYLAEAEARVAGTTAVSTTKGVWRSMDGTSAWWLRTMADGINCQAVSTTGTIIERNAHQAQSGIRPALWVNLQVDIF